MNVQQFSTTWGGRELKVELGRYAQQAHGSCTVQYGDTVVLATAVMSDSVRDGINWFPLMVDYEEKLYAAGKIKGSRFIKREGRPTDEAVLAGRQIDRSIRPLFDDRIKNDIQVVITVLSLDEDNDPSVIGLIAASLVLTISDIPWNGPIAAARIGNIDGKWILNPTYAEKEESTLDVFVAGTPDLVAMVEAGAKNASDELCVAAMEEAQNNLTPVLDLIEEVRQAVGVEKRNIETLIERSEEQVAAKAEEDRVMTIAKQFVKDHAEQYVFDSPKTTKKERKAAFTATGDALKAHLAEQGITEELITFATSDMKKLVEAEVTRMIIEKEQRVDGRKLNEIRQLTIETGLLPRTHGSGHFLRGETQVLSVTTLAGPGAEQIIDTMEFDTKKRYMHHYNFPAFSVGEARPSRGPGRREIGHGALAERALEAVLPEKADFPYTIRVVSEVFGSNGSSSMASTCGSTLALMNAGVPIAAPVAGIAMGLASDDAGNWKVLTDLQDLEDGKGGMDFKITGTRDGITAIQMDTKTSGLNKDIVRQTFIQAREALNNLLDAMGAVVAEPQTMSPYAPRIETIQIDPEKIRDVIGTGGKVINGIIDETGVEIDIEDSGLVMVTSKDAAGMAKAVEIISAIVKEVEAGETYTGKVVRIEDFGAFVNILPNKDGLVHVSEIAWERTERVGDALKIGQEVKVIVKEIDSMNRINLSIKELLPKPEGYEDRPSRKPHGEKRRGPGGDRHHSKKKRGLFHRKKD